ncbi:hypothetical protein QBC35DRAFT_70208 [Podospora australis]|uniref:Uncharacterized protein n=1 Tax=Podospora australis TaxID=1536484 RepID=A0AAN7ALI8_9PEZI|nr:hypothetical protein QBC35DRAFT_70208 [Podospora australis]
MLRRPYQAGSALRVSQRACELVFGGRLIQSAKSPFVALHSVRRLANLSPASPTWKIASRSFTTSQPCLKAKRQQSPPTPQSLGGAQTRFNRVSSSSDSKETPAVEDVGTTTPQAAAPNLAEITAAVDRVTKAFMANTDIPSEDLTLTALRACAQTEVRQAADIEESHHMVAAAEDRPVSRLLGLDGDDAKKAGRSNIPAATPVLRPEDVVDKVSEAAYAIVTHPTVVITPQVLAEYVRLQARLGRPQTLPQVLALYASKPKPKLVAGSITYIPSNPNKAEKAVDNEIADAALDAAIEAKNLEAAVGVLESTYSSKAFLRSKLLKKAVLPASLVAVAPVALWVVATQLAQLNYSLDNATAVKYAFIGVFCYVGFTGTIGAVAAFTSNDQMKRVTWAIGTPLTHRWLYEEERATLDKIACAFGFSEEHRFGEEEGEEYLWLREYMLKRSMILDSVDLMPGMN